MGKENVTSWQATITYKPGRYVSEGEPETLIGPLRALECYIRRNDDRITFVTLVPCTAEEAS